MEYAYVCMYHFEKLSIDSKYNMHDNIFYRLSNQSK